MTDEEIIIALIKRAWFYGWQGEKDFRKNPVTEYSISFNSLYEVVRITTGIREDCPYQDSITTLDFSTIIFDPKFIEALCRMRSVKEGGNISANSYKSRLSLPSIVRFELSQLVVTGEMTSSDRLEYLKQEFLEDDGK